MTDTTPATHTYVLAGGCFWCLDAAYRVMRGIERVESVYTGGHTPHPTYEQVCGQHTGHAEAVRVRFNADVIPEDVVLDAFFTMHDPTQLNRQGNDVGEQYRSEMFYADEAQRARFETAKARASHWYDTPIVTRISPLEEVWMAEEQHQDFFSRNPTQAYCVAVALPKVQKIRQSFRDYLREAEKGSM